MQTNLEVFARKNNPDIEEYQEIFRMIQEQTERLSHLSEVLLDMTGIQSIERSDSISLAALTDEVFCDLISVADQKEVELIQKDGDCTVIGSYLLLYRAVYNLVENAIKYVEANIGRCDLSVEELSRGLGMSRVHLYKKLLQITGKTPIEFIRVIRLKRAAQMLRESQQNVSEIAYQLGFNNPKYFSKYFKDEFGVLPSVYQEREGR